MQLIAYHTITIHIFTYNKLIFIYRVNKKVFIIFKKRIPNCEKIIISPKYNSKKT